MARVLERSNNSATSNGNNGLNVPHGAQFQFEGVKSRTKEQLQRLMYTDEMDQWLAEARREEANQEARRRQHVIAVPGVPDVPKGKVSAAGGNWSGLCH